jgi:hypothetical protein
VQTARRRRHARCGPPSSSFCDPLPRRVRVCPGVTAQVRGLPRQRLIKLALAEALQEACHLCQEIGPASGELVQLPHRGRALVFGELAPPRMALRRAVPCS